MYREADGFACRCPRRGYTSAAWWRQDFNLLLPAHSYISLTRMCCSRSAAAGLRCRPVRVTSLYSSVISDGMLRIFDVINSVKRRFHQLLHDAVGIVHVGVRHRPVRCRPRGQRGSSGATGACFRSYPRAAAGCGRGALLRMPGIKPSYSLIIGFLLLPRAV